MLKILYISLVLIFSTYHIYAYTIHMKDDKVYRSVSKFKNINGYILYKINGKNYTVNSIKIKDIRDNSNNIVFENKNYTFNKQLTNNGKEFFVFFINHKKLAEADWDDNGKFTIYNGSIPDGIYLQYYDSGKLERSFSIGNNNLNGKCTLYYKSGKLEKEAIFKEGYEKGISRIFYKTGELKGESNYNRGSKEGLTTLYYKTGKHKSLMYFKNGVLDGLQKMFYKNGEISAKVNYARGNKNGKFFQYFENGKIKMTGSLKNGKLNGEVITYYESGRVKRKQFFSKGRILKNK